MQIFICPTCKNLLVDIWDYNNNNNLFSLVNMNMIMVRHNDNTVIQ